MTRKPEEALEGMGGRKKLSAQELEFMKLIWQKPEGISSEEIYEAFLPGMARGTISAVLVHIVEKRYATFEREGRNSIYIPTVSRLAYEQAVLRQKMKRYLGVGSITALVGMFCGRETLSTADEEEIGRLLRKLEQEGRE